MLLVLNNLMNRRSTTRSIDLRSSFLRGHVRLSLTSWSYSHKSSAAAEMGNCLATIDMDRKVREGCGVLSGEGEAGSPSNTMSPWPKPTSVPSGIQPFGHNTPTLQTGQTGQRSDRANRFTKVAPNTCARSSAAEAYGN